MRSSTTPQEEYARYLEWLKWPISDEYITWPTAKHNHPLTYFAANTAWSVTLNRNVFDTASTASVIVSLTRQRDGRTWTFSTSGNDGYFNVAEANVAYDQCIIFRPNGVDSYNDGEIWSVYVTGLPRQDGTIGTISYTVQFTSSTTGYEDSGVVSVPSQNSNDGGGSGGCNSGFGAIIAVLALGIPRAGKFMRDGR